MQCALLIVLVMVAGGGKNPAYFGSVRDRTPLISGCFQPVDWVFSMIIIREIHLLHTIALFFCFSESHFTQDESPPKKDLWEST